MLDPKNIVIRISMNAASRGKMLYVSNSIEEFYGWKPVNLLGRNVNMIMPKFIQEVHQQKLNEQVESGRNSRMNRNILAYGSNSQGYLVPQHIYISSV